MNCSPCWTPDRGARIKFRLILRLLAYSVGPVMAAGSSKPDFGPNVLVFNSSMAAATMQERIDKVYATQQNNQFGPARNALLFAPGDYKLDIPIGYYTQVLGLGASPDSVHITGNVHSDATLPRNNATCTFWKAAEGFSVTPTGGAMKWAVSQAVPFRRMHIRGDIVLHQDGGWASGGWMSDDLIDGNVGAGPQQQWISRNTEWGSWTGANWNMVFVGVVSPPAGRMAQPALHQNCPGSDRSREALPSGRCERELQRPRSGAADQQFGRHLARRVHTGQIDTPEPSSTSPGRTSTPPRRSMPSWPGGRTCCSRPASTN